MPELVDVPVLTLGRTVVGRFRCHPHHSRFRNTGPAEHHLVVFPRTSVWIRHAGREAVLADATRAILYNRGQEYTRAAIADEGDRCEWFAFDSETIVEIAGRFDAGARQPIDRPFAMTHASVDARTYALQRRIYEHATRVRRPDVLFLEEALLLVLSWVVRSAYRHVAPDRPAQLETGRQHRQMVDAAKQLLGARLDESLALTSIAGALNQSPFHVAHVFRHATGIGLHAYRTQLRLRASLERVAAGEDLSRVALDLGFSSHAHFTMTFGRVFGVSPSAFRKNLKAARWHDQ